MPERGERTHAACVHEVGKVRTARGVVQQGSFRGFSDCGRWSGGLSFRPLFRMARREGECEGDRDLEVYTRHQHDEPVAQSNTTCMRQDRGFESFQGNTFAFSDGACVADAEGMIGTPYC